MMKWIAYFKKRNNLQEEVGQEKQLLLQEIRKAHADWMTAQMRFDYVIGKEQIDYAIYALEAAEKRFEMLLKQAKDLKLTSEILVAPVVEGKV